VAVVTGGGWNIGRAIAERLAAEGARVVVAGRRAERLAETCALIEKQGGEARAIACDVTDLAAVETMMEETAATFGGIDILAAIAGGGGGYEPIDVIDPAWWDHVVRLNLVGSFHQARAALPHLRHSDHASILFCTGGGAFFPLEGMHATAYATAKAGICRFTDQLALELMSESIRVNCLQPGLTWSPERLREIEAEEEQTGAPHGSRADNHPPSDAAELAAWLVSDASQPLTGRTVSVDEDWWRDPEQVRAVAQSLHAACLRRMGPDA